MLISVYPVGALHSGSIVRFDWHPVLRLGLSAKQCSNHRRTVAHTELRTDAVDIGGGGVRADPQIMRNLFRAEAAGDVLRDLLLSPCEARQVLTQAILSDKNVAHIVKTKARNTMLLIEGVGNFPRGRGLCRGNGLKDRIF